MPAFGRVRNAVHNRSGTPRPVNLRMGSFLAYHDFRVLCLNATRLKRTFTSTPKLRLPEQSCRFFPAPMHQGAERLSSGRRTSSQTTGGPSSTTLRKHPGAERRSASRLLIHHGGGRPSAGRLVIQHVAGRPSAGGLVPSQCTGRRSAGGLVTSHRAGRQSTDGLSWHSYLRGAC